MELPVLAQEMRVRQRGVRPFIVTLVYVLALSIVALIFTNSIGSYNALDASQLNRQGRDLFLFLVMAQLVMISLIVPAYSSVVVTTEREKGTFVLLALTMLSSDSIVRQKLSAAIAEVLMLTFTALPVLALVFLYGGVTPLQLAAACAIFVMTSLLLGSFGVFCSCVFANSRVATSVAYLGMFVFLLLLPLGAEWLKSVSHDGLIASAEAIPFVLIGLLVFVGGLGALGLYGVVSPALKRRARLWFVRAFRMAVFGACYAVVLAVIAVPSLSGFVIQILFGLDSQVSLPMFVNPFVAAISLVGPGAMADRAVPIVSATLVFAALSTCLFVSLSGRRFGVLRRS